MTPSHPADHANRELQEVAVNVRIAGATIEVLQAVISLPVLWTLESSR